MPQAGINQASRFSLMGRILGHSVLAMSGPKPKQEAAPYPERRGAGCKPDAVRRGFARFAGPVSGLMMMAHAATAVFTRMTPVLM
jgi:hypothetical protein